MIHFEQFFSTGLKAPTNFLFPFDFRGHPINSHYQILNEHMAAKQSIKPLTHDVLFVGVLSKDPSQLETDFPHNEPDTLW